MRQSGDVKMICPVCKKHGLRATPKSHHNTLVIDWSCALCKFSMRTANTVFVR